MMTLTDAPSRTGSLLDEITALKRKRNAVILAHNYQIAPIQDVARLCRGLTLVFHNKPRLRTLK